MSLRLFDAKSVSRNFFNLEINKYLTVISLRLCDTKIVNRNFFNLAANKYLTVMSLRLLKAKSVSRRSFHFTVGCRGLHAFEVVLWKQLHVVLHHKNLPANKLCIRHY